MGSPHEWQNELFCGQCSTLMRITLCALQLQATSRLSSINVGIESAIMIPSEQWRQL